MGDRVGDPRAARARLAPGRPTGRTAEEDPGRLRRREDPAVRARGVAARRARRRGRGSARHRRGPRYRGAQGAVSQTQLQQGVGEILVEADDLRRRVAELGDEVSRDYEGRDLLLIGVLKGAVFFMADLMRELKARQPATLEVCALMTKPERRQIDVRVRYTGFEIPNKFVVGYGLDFAERYRNLPYVALLSDELLPEGG